MFLVELVLQGIRGFQQLARVRFQGGFNFVSAGSEGGKTTSVDTIVRLLFPTNQPAAMETLVSRVTPDASRGALVVYSDDSSYYRIIQDFSKQAVNLSRFNPGTKEFTLMHKDWVSAAQFMAGLLPGISEDDYGRLFVFRRDVCAGQSAADVSAPAPTPVQADRGRPASAPAGKRSAEEARLAELREVLRKAEEAADAEYKLDAAKIRMGEVAKRIEQFEESRQRADELAAQIAELKVCEMLPENLSEMIGAHEQEQTQKMARTDELEQDIESLTNQRDGIPQVNLMTDKLFIGGSAVAVLSLVAAVFILSEEQSVFFPIGMLGALLLMAAGWYNSSRKNTQRRELQKDIDALVKERADLDKKFQEGGSAILKCMQATNSTTTAELKEKADNYRYFQTLYQEIQEQQRLSLSGQDYEALPAEYEKLQGEVAELRTAAQALAHNAVDTYSVRQEIDRIESELSPVSQDFGFGGGDLGSDFT